MRPDRAAMPRRRNCRTRSRSGQFPGDGPPRDTIPGRHNPRLKRCRRSPRPSREIRLIDRLDSSAEATRPSRFAPARPGRASDALRAAIKAQRCRNRRRRAVLSNVRPDMPSGLIYFSVGRASADRARSLRATGEWPREPEAERCRFLASPGLASSWSLAAAPD